MSEFGEQLPEGINQDPLHYKFDPGFYGDGDEGRKMFSELQGMWDRSDASRGAVEEQLGLFRSFYDAGVKGKNMPDIPEGVDENFMNQIFQAGRTDVEEEKQRTPLSMEQRRLLRLIGFPDYGIRRKTPEDAEKIIEEANKKLPEGLAVGQKVVWKGRGATVNKVDSFESTKIVISTEAGGGNSVDVDELEISN